MESNNEVMSQILAELRQMNSGMESMGSALYSMNKAQSARIISGDDDDGYRFIHNPITSGSGNVFSKSPSVRSIMGNERTVSTEALKAEEHREMSETGYLKIFSEIGDEMLKLSKAVDTQLKKTKAYSVAVEKLQKTVNATRDTMGGFGKAIREAITDISPTGSRLLGTDGDRKSGYEKVVGNLAHKKGGFTAAYRRGLLDVNRDYKETTMVGKFGAFMGRLGAGATEGSFGKDERAAWGNKFLHRDAEYARAINPDAAGRQELLSHEVRQLEEHRNDVISGKVKMRGGSIDEHMELTQKELIHEKNLRALMDPSREAVHLSGYDAFREEAMQGLGLKSNKQISTPEQSHLEITEPSEQKIVPTGESIKDFISEEKLGASIAKSLREINELNIKEFKSDSMEIKTLTIGALIKPEEEKAEGAANGSSGFDATDLMDLKSGKGAKPKGSPIKSGIGKMAGKALMLAAAGESVYSGVSDLAEGKKVESLGDVVPEGWDKINPFSWAMRGGEYIGDKLESGYGGLSSFMGGTGSLGTDIYSLFNKEIDPTTPTLIKPKDIAATPDQKSQDLAAARAENEQLVSEEKAATAAPGPVVVNAPTTNISSGSRAPVMPSLARPSYNAFERFVDRVFTAV